MKWNQGRDAIEAMLKAGEMQRVPASRERADLLLAQADTHLATARRVGQDDPEGAYVLVYDAARKALVALLENEGLRPTSRAGHHGIYLAVKAQLDPPLGKALRPFERMRRLRNDLECPDFVGVPISVDNVLEDAKAAETIVMMVRQAYDEMAVF